VSIKIALTMGEKFKAQRRREGMSHAECAKDLKVPCSVIKHWEDDLPSIPEVTIDMTAGELYYVLRERLGLPLKKAAKLMNISHITLIKLEKQEGGHEVLKAFYKKYMKKHNIKLKGINLS